MPQKRNPDAAELTRAKSGRIIGALVSLLVVLKGLPLGYSKDLQEDKEPVFEAADTLTLTLRATAAMVHDMQVSTNQMAAAAAEDFATATDLADWLVRVANKPFREAHTITGNIVAYAERRGIGLAELSLEELQKFDPHITNDVFHVLSPTSSVSSRTSYGGTSPAGVRAAIAAARQRFLAEQLP